MDLTNRQDIIVDSDGVSRAVANLTVADKQLLDSLLQELSNAVVLSGVPLTTATDQLYLVVDRLRSASADYGLTLSGHYTKALSRMVSKINGIMDEVNKGISDMNARLSAKRDRAYQNMNNACDSLTAQLNDYAQTLAGLPFAWPSDAKYPPKWFSNRPIKRDDGSITPEGQIFYRLCVPADGSSFDTSLYPMLAKRYPSGVLPDYRDQFLRGHNGNTMTNPDNTPVGQQQSDAIYLGVNPGENSGSFYMSGTEQSSDPSWADCSGCFSTLPGTASSQNFSGGHGSHSKHNVYDNRTQVTFNMSGIPGISGHLDSETRPRSVPVVWLIYTGIHPNDLGVGERDK